MRLCTTIPVTLRRRATGKLKQRLLNLSLLAQEASIVVWLLIHTSFAFKEICNSDIVEMSRWLSIFT